MGTTNEGTSTSAFDAGFELGVEADDVLAENLNLIITSAADYKTAIENLISYFTEENLWTGDDAKALQSAVTAANGPLKKLEKYEEELAKLSKLAESLRNALSEAQGKLKDNVQTAMKVGEE